MTGKNMDVHAPDGFPLDWSEDDDDNYNDDDSDCYCE